MVSLEVAVQQAAQEMIDSVINDADFRTEVNQMLAEKYDPYVPYVTGRLATNIVVDENGINYQQPYADKVYSGSLNHNREHHPLATSYWDDVAYASNKEEIDNEVKEILERWIKTKQS